MTELIPSLRTGTVVAFDAQVGLGEVDADDGARLPFHCIVIADGSRSIEVGARVSFDLPGQARPVGSQLDPTGLSGRAGGGRPWTSRRRRGPNATSGSST